MPSSSPVSTSTSLSVTQRKQNDAFSEDFHGTTFVQRDGQTARQGLAKRPRRHVPRPPSDTESTTSWSDARCEKPCRPKTFSSRSRAASFEERKGSREESYDEDDASSIVSAHDWTAVSGKARANCGVHASDGEPHANVVGTPELWDALSSLGDDDCSHLSTVEKHDRYDQSHDVGVVDWGRMDKLMVTHEYGAWTHRMRGAWPAHAVVNCAVRQQRSVQFGFVWSISSLVARLYVQWSTCRNAPLRCTVMCHLC